MPNVNFLPTKAAGCHAGAGPWYGLGCGGNDTVLMWAMTALQPATRTRAGGRHGLAPAKLVATTTTRS